MGQVSTKRRCWTCLLVFIAGFVGAFVLFSWPWEAADLPPISDSPFLNVSDKATYVGGQTCAECHADEHATYLQTTHSLTLTEIDLSKEPPDMDFGHDRSRRSFRVYRKGGELRHRELVGGDEEMVLADYPMRYAIGSGNHSRSYLVEADGFLLESPITWYTARKNWWVSPGYDLPIGTGFERVASAECLYCHVGRFESVDDSLYRVKLGEQAIGCERCHGPGSLHVQKHRADNAAETDFDTTIVHPARLTRDQSESICAQCHLDSAASVDLMGRKLKDYRPGMLSKDFRVFYRLKTSDNAMQVVGHVEQMRLSRCHEASETLTCTTCHDPHHKPVGEERLTYYRSRCLECHAVDACGLEPAERLRRDSQDDCIACHMPQSQTEIPHFAFTHHRIGVHESKLVTPTEEAEREVGTLVPLDDVSNLPRIQQDRNLGLAYAELVMGDEKVDPGLTYWRRATELLEDVTARGLDDPAVDVVLARLYFKSDRRLAIELAETVLESDKLSSHICTTALVAAGRGYAMLNKPDKAIPFLERLVKMRRDAEDWHALSTCREALGDSRGALMAVHSAAQISPARPDLQGLLGTIYEQRGDTKMADYYQKRAVRLFEQTNWRVRVLPMVRFEFQ